MDDDAARICEMREESRQARLRRETLLERRRQLEEEEDLEWEERLQEQSRSRSHSYSHSHGHLARDRDRDVEQEYGMERGWERERRVSLHGTRSSSSSGSGSGGSWAPAAQPVRPATATITFAEHTAQAARPDTSLPPPPPSQPQLMAAPQQESRRPADDPEGTGLPTPASVSASASAPTRAPVEPAAATSAAADGVPHVFQISYGPPGPIGVTLYPLILHATREDETLLFYAAVVMESRGTPAIRRGDVAVSVNGAPLIAEKSQVPRRSRDGAPDGDQHVEVVKNMIVGSAAPDRPRVFRFFRCPGIDPSAGQAQLSEEEALVLLEGYQRP